MAGTLSAYIVINCWDLSRHILNNFFENAKSSIVTRICPAIFKKIEKLLRNFSKYFKSGYEDFSGPNNCIIMLSRTVSAQTQNCAGNILNTINVWLWHSRHFFETRCDICSVWVLSYRSMFCVFSMICACISCSDMRNDMRDDMRSGAWYAHQEVTCIIEYFSSIIEYFSSKVLSVDDLCL